MKLVKRAEVLVRLGQWLQQNDSDWNRAKKSASQHNKWFTEDFIDHRTNVLTDNFLDKKKLNDWIKYYHIDDNISPRKLGIVMPGNIPLAGFHDFLCCFISGHHSHIKLSGKDEILFKKLVSKMAELDPETRKYISLQNMLSGCDAYITSGSNNTSRYFEYYFGKYPSVIRKNKTSVAVLTGRETDGQLEKLADDVFVYFGLGCRSVTQIYVPKDYDFPRLLKLFNRYSYLRDHTGFGNNYDYHLALLIMNDQKYMSNSCVIMVEGNYLFSPIGELYYSFYEDKKHLLESLRTNESIQCIVSEGEIGFGESQNTGLYDYSDGIDIMQFLLEL